MKSPLGTLLLPLLASSFTVRPSTQVRSQHVLLLTRQQDVSPLRRNLFIGTLVAASAGLLIPSDKALAVEQAVGAAEKACREAGNCLEKGDWDAAVGGAGVERIVAMRRIPRGGLGFGSSGKEDEAFSNAFQITASAVPGMDKEGRKVVGQVLDEPSMAFLARLAKLPTNKGIKGIIPGQDGGPPLLKVVVTDLEVQTAKDYVSQA
ncbi:hypothetical protein MHU86_3525 [Fragilaria crotonensis]|nr:hypothetical protein MHU86_3525 [Fragilaria crotonensis]